jgi:hypothetical protein
MPRYYEPDLTVDPNSPFVRDAANKLVHAPPVLVSHFIGQLEGPTASSPIASTGCCRVRRDGISHIAQPNISAP